MKLKIVTKDHKNYTELFKIESGEIFRPMNSQAILMRLYNDYNDDCWNECESRLMQYYENPHENEIVNGMEDTIPCVDMVTGEIVFFHQDLKVTKLNYRMEIED